MQSAVQQELLFTCIVLNTIIIRSNQSGLNPFIEGPISLFQVSYGSCPDFSIISVLGLFGLSDISKLNQICDVIRKFVILLEKIHKVRCF